MIFIQLIEKFLKISQIIITLIYDLVTNLNKIQINEKYWKSVKNIQKNPQSEFIKRMMQKSHKGLKSATKTF